MSELSNRELAERYANILFMLENLVEKVKNGTPEELDTAAQDAEAFLKRQPR